MARSVPRKARTSCFWGTPWLEAARDRAISVSVYELRQKILVCSFQRKWKRGDLSLLRDLPASNPRLEAPSTAPDSDSRPVKLLVATYEYAFLRRRARVCARVRKQARYVG